MWNTNNIVLGKPQKTRRRVHVDYENHRPVTKVLKGNDLVHYHRLHWEKYISVSPFFTRNSPIIYGILTPENLYRTASYFLSDFTYHRKLYYKIGGFFRKNIIQFPIEMSN